MRRIFVELPNFRAMWEAFGLNDEQLALLQQQLLDNPEAGVVMQGTGGLRKIRFHRPGQGKSGGCRVCYLDFEKYERIYLLIVFGKNQKENLSKAEKQVIKRLVKTLKDEVSGR